MKIKNSKTKEMLKYLALGSGIVILSILNPTLPTHLLKAYIKSRKFKRAKFLEDLKRLQQRELIDYQIINNDRVKITLRKAGKEKILEYNIENIKLDKNKKWDGKWRLVIFDIPDKKKKARDALRQKIKTMELYPLQKSVYITPYRCEDEIDFVCNFFQVQNHILLLTVSNFEGAGKLKKYFKL